MSKHKTIPNYFLRVEQSFWNKNADVNQLCKEFFVSNLLSAQEVMISQLQDFSRHKKYALALLC